MRTWETDDLEAFHQVISDPRVHAYTGEEEYEGETWSFYRITKTEFHEHPHQ